MHGINLLIWGTVPAPVGPVNVFGMHRRIAKGWKAEVVAGIGASAADTLYGTIAGLSMGFSLRCSFAKSSGSGCSAAIR